MDKLISLRQSWEPSSVDIVNIVFADCPQGECPTFKPQMVRSQFTRTYNHSSEFWTVVQPYILKLSQYNYSSIITRYGIEWTVNLTSNANLFSDIFLLVWYDEVDEGYRIQIFSEENVPLFGPPLPVPALFQDLDEFREFLLVKCRLYASYYQKVLQVTC